MQTLKYPAHVTPTGNWGSDNELGRELADAYLRQAREERSPAGLAQVIGEITKAGRWSGIEVGFAFAFAEAAI